MTNTEYLAFLLTGCPQCEAGKIEVITTSTTALPD